MAITEKVFFERYNESVANFYLKEYKRRRTVWNEHLPAKFLVALKKQAAMEIDVAVLKAAKVKIHNIPVTCADALDWLDVIRPAGSSLLSLGKIFKGGTCLTKAISEADRKSSLLDKDDWMDLDTLLEFMIRTMFVIQFFPVLVVEKQFLDSASAASHFTVDEWAPHLFPALRQITDMKPSRFVIFHNKALARVQKASSPEQGLKDLIERLRKSKVLKTMAKANRINMKRFFVDFWKRK